MQPALPVVAAVEMGYGHLRAAHALAAELGTEVGLYQILERVTGASRRD